jgi:hypothetical protein
MRTPLGQRRLVVSLLVVLSGVLGLPRQSPAHVTEFSCAAGDVACLIDAINQANASGEANTITLEAGTYTLTAVDNTTDGANGLPSMTSLLTIRGAGVDTTIIEPDASAPPFRLVHVAATGTLTLEGLTLRGGGGSEVQAVDQGGGIFNRGTVTLTHSALTDTRARFNGAGLFNQNGTVAVANSQIARNALTFIGEGGGLDNQSGTVTIAASLVVNNSVSSGGGIHNNGGTLTLTQTTLAHNGAGSLVSLSGTVLLTDSTVADNASVGFQAGGIDNNGTLLLMNSTLAGNFGLSTGGLGSFLRTGTAIVTNTTVADNQTESGAGGILAGASTVLVNTILTRNTPVDCGGPVTSLGTNLVGNPTGCTITLLPTDLTGDPGLGDYTDDGTPGNGHFPLLPGSAAIDAGNDAFCPPTDQLDQPRVGRCDIGAIEFPGEGNHQ